MEVNSVHGIQDILSKIVSIVVWVVAVPLLLLILLGFGYLLALGGVLDASPNAANELSALISTIWGKVIPLGESALRLLAPFLVLLVVLAGIKMFSAASDENDEKVQVFSDLPSVLALIIIGSICILPFAGYGVPEVLQNVALVVVGFYFGKRDRNDA
ncbi:hypothetical protein MARI_01540 [Marinobacter sp. JH2]|nr:hypothetical protein MARI_01540 [Marinobacter sp. JH2]